LQSLTVHNLYVGEGLDFTGVPTKMLTVNVTLRMSIYNPATFFGIHVHSTPINLVFSDITIATGEVRIILLPISSAKQQLWHNIYAHQRKYINRDIKNWKYIKWVTITNIYIGLWVTFCSWRNTISQEKVTALYQWMWRVIRFPCMVLDPP